MSGVKLIQGFKEAVWYPSTPRIRQKKKQNKTSRIISNPITEIADTVPFVDFLILAFVHLP